MLGLPLSGPHQHGRPQEVLDKAQLCGDIRGGEEPGPWEQALEMVVA